MCIVCIAILVLFFTADSKVFSYVSCCVGALSLIAPVLAFLKPPYNAWKSLVGAFIEHKEDVETPEHECTPEACASSSFGVEDERISKYVHTEKHHMSLIDPFSVMRQDEWVSFLRSESNIFTGLRAGAEKWRFIAPVVFMCISIIVLVLDIHLNVASINEIDTMKQSILAANAKWAEGSGLEFAMEMDNSMVIFETPNSIFGLVMRCLLGIYLLPFAMTANIVTLFINWKKAKHTSIKATHVVATVLVFLYFVVFTAGAVLTNMSIETFKPGYTNSSSLYVPVTNKITAGVCDVRLNGATMLEMAAVTVMAQLRQTDIASFRVFFEEFFGSKTKRYLSDQVIVVDGKNVPVEYYEEWSEENDETDRLLPIFGYEFENIFPFAGAVKEVKNSLYGEVTTELIVLGAFAGLTDTKHLSILMENVVKYWHGVAMSAIIPFFSFVKSMILGTVLDELSKYVDTWFLGFVSPSDQLMMMQSWILCNLARRFPLFIGLFYPGARISAAMAGHSAGGLFAKSLAAAEGYQVITFESPKLENSRMYEILNRKRNNVLGWETMLNVYSPGSFTSMAETNATANFVLPQAQSIVKPANVYSTFCEIAAGCATDDRYDHFCSYAIGRETYEAYFDLWERPRTVPVHD